MIFLTVGSQVPFDRLVSYVDRWASTRPDVDVLAQIGTTELRPSYLRSVESMPPSEYEEAMSACELVVAHAGMGTILSALEQAKPIILFPRRADLRETRSDHQLSTAERFADRPGVMVARDEPELIRLLDADHSGRSAPPPSPASAQLIDALRRFIEGS